MDSTGSRSDWVSSAAGVTTALGLLTFALFPLALPILLLTIVATLPLALPLIALAAIAAIVTAAWLGVRAVGRGIRAQADVPTRDSLQSALGDVAATRPRP